MTNCKALSSLLMLDWACEKSFPQPHSYNCTTQESATDYFSAPKALRNFNVTVTFTVIEPMGASVGPKIELCGRYPILTPGSSRPHSNLRLLEYDAERLGNLRPLTKKTTPTLLCQLTIDFLLPSDYQMCSEIFLK